MGGGVAAVLLAAGGGKRWRASGGSEHKLLALINNTAVVRLALDHALAAGLKRTVVVTGAVDLAAVIPDGVTVLHNEHWDRGQSTSLALALRYAAIQGFDAVVVGLGDQPFVDSEAWQRVATTNPESPIAVATYHGQRGQPVRLGAAIWPLIATTGDEGARALLRGQPELVVEVPCSGNPADIDTMEDLQRWS